MTETTTCNLQQLRVGLLLTNRSGWICLRRTTTI